MAARAEWGWQSRAGAGQGPANLGAAVNPNAKSGGFTTLIPRAGSSCLPAGSPDAGREPCLGQAGPRQRLPNPWGVRDGPGRGGWAGGSPPARQIAGPALATPTGFVD